MDAIAIVVTTATREEAERIARTVVEAKLVACAQVSGPITSVYRWQGSVQTATEWRCWLKTREELYKQVEEAVLAVHSYQIPQIIAFPIVAAHRPYLDWLEQETSPD